jgi:hypothetical protein
MECEIYIQLQNWNVKWMEMYHIVYARNVI